MKATLATKIALLSVAMTVMVALSARPSVAAILTNSTIPLSFTFFDPCSGHTFDVNALVHVVASTTFDNAGFFHTTLHINDQAEQDTDTTTGEVCRGTDNQLFSALNFNVLTGAVGGLPIEDTTRGTALLICPSGLKASNTFLAHITVDPNGTVTVNFSNLPGVVTCK